MRAEIAISPQRYRDSSFCAKSVRYNIFTNGAPYSSLNSRHFQSGKPLQRHYFH